ncbi:VacJ family lipoprotein [Psychrobium sp. 1_MG-2023]|uniref:MlaA family lipoprotein n=1 Tax=Psychrobium sp. 1_MG-2023 TaxID=3062624 RepID=UPI000C32C216|nr:VacJ family lipoprotein [Psychrobium sp. 1_MG-2023]MDP2562074.1 VacJ family lipoprotein [Psychrobium sp. 1_MG-2023]PKF55675.1 ABC transporter [Alteromonadales bacterium alter-6D02]
MNTTPKVKLIKSSMAKVALALGLSLSMSHAFAQETTEPVAENEQADIVLIDAERSDPFEGFNRAMWDFNRNVLDLYLFKPAAVAYRDYLPVPVQTSVYSFAVNLEEPSSTVNNMLQGNVEDSSNAFARFLINSTAGLFGLFDVASKIGLERKSDEFGEVLAVNGVSSGPYLMLPALGPTTIRNEVGDVVDNLYFPATEISFWPSITVRLLKGLHTRAQLLDQEGLLNNSLDQYEFVKEAYFQQSLFDIYDGNVPVVEDTSLDDFDDDFDELD